MCSQASLRRRCPLCCPAMMMMSDGESKDTKVAGNMTETGYRFLVTQRWSCVRVAPRGRLGGWWQERVAVFDSKRRFYVSKTHISTSQKVYMVVTILSILRLALYVCFIRGPSLVVDSYHGHQNLVPTSRVGHDPDSRTVALPKKSLPCSRPFPLCFGLLSSRRICRSQIQAPPFRSFCHIWNTHQIACRSVVNPHACHAIASSDRRASPATVECLSLSLSLPRHHRRIIVSPPPLRRAASLPP